MPVGSREAATVQREFDASLRLDGVLAVKWDLSKLAFDELQNPLGSNLARGRGAGLRRVGRKGPVDRRQKAIVCPT
jgi:hypothetical protein